VTEFALVAIVDDDASVRAGTTRLLRSLGFSACAFASAREFLLSPQFSNTACLIADIEMPGMNGVELQEHLIAHGHSTPIVFITAYPDDNVRDRVMSAGAVDFLRKPFDEVQLIKCVEQALRGRSSAARG
jgi:FixJ family two-component response regulator